MSPHAARLFFGCSISFLLGGAAGVFGLRTLYGDVDRVDPEPARRLECPPPPPCPACPAPVNCEEPFGQLPPESEPEGGLETVPELDTADVVDAPPPLPGLPASVIPLAQRAVREAVAPCLDGLVEPEPGVALLQLTVTVEDEEGGIREALVTRATGGAGSIVDCLAEAAREARFSRPGPDGQIEVRLPISVGAP